MYNQCYCVFPLVTLAHYLHTWRAHDSPTKPHFLLCHIGNSDTIRNTSRKQSHMTSYNPTSHHTSSTATFLFDIVPVQRISFIFDDGQCNLVMACATRVFYIWRRPAQPGDGLRNAYLLSLATASATWRRPAQLVSLIFGDDQRNLATARAIC